MTPALEALRKQMPKLITCMHTYLRMLKEVVSNSDISNSWIDMAHEYSLKGVGGKCSDVISSKS